MRQLRLFPLPVKCLLAVGFGIGAALLLGEATVLRVEGYAQAKNTTGPANIAIDYPVAGSVFPPDITAPTFLWRDSSEAAVRWIVKVSFADHSTEIRVEAAAEPLQQGEIDSQVSGPVPLTDEQKATRTWKPDAATWAAIRRRSVDSPATIVISGFADASSTDPVSRGTVTISTSQDPVAAPIFYRDVPLMTVPHTEKGSIQPLPTSALPLIKWRIRDIAQPQSRVVMESLHTCANCHSFSFDGKTMGLDMDGPRNDKGLYALVPLAKEMTIRNQDVLRWSSFQEDLGEKSTEPALKRFGFMSQISPDGQYVVTSIGPPNLGDSHQNEHPGFAPGLSDRLYNANYSHLGFNQVFYPTRGILAWYDRKRKKLRPLPGADDPHFVQTSAFWSPDGKYLIFSRAVARDPYPPGGQKPQYANDPNETQIQYDLYRIPFNDGRGGKAEPVVGASGNGMSNDFPKVSPDRRWIVFVQNHNGLLMRPDSKLYIVPFAGGKARLMNCNLSLMNSWHSFSPNGHWLAFSSKGRSIYTQLMLTHIDVNGNDSPAVVVENTTLANRAVNIPEFINIPPDGMQRIEPQAAEVYRVADNGFDLMGKGAMGQAVPEWRKAVQMDPDDPNWHFNLGVSLWATDQKAEAIEEFGRTCDLDPNESKWYGHLAARFKQTDDLDATAVKLDIACYRKALSLEPSDAKAEAALGVALFRDGRTQEGYEALRKAVEMAPENPDSHNQLATVLARMGRLGDAIAEIHKAIQSSPSSAEYRYNLGFALKMQGDLSAAIAAFQKSVELSAGKDARCLAALASAYEKAGRLPEAIQAARQGIDAAGQQQDKQNEQDLRNALERYQREGAGARQ